jgi:hypothetical protein
VLQHDVGDFVRDGIVLPGARVAAVDDDQAFAAIAQRCRRTNDNDFRNKLVNAVGDICDAAASDDGREGLQAFVEKRKPRWQA